MLLPLSLVDLLDHQPDVAGLDLWSKAFVWSEIPAGIGCYGFFDGSDLVYVGSACSAADSSPSNVGLRMRLRYYRGRGKSERPSATVRRVREYALRHRLLLSCWVAANPGDCRKYEEDTLRKWHPILNVIGAKTVAPEDLRLRRAKWARDRLAKLREQNRTSFDPDRIRECTRCKKRKPCRMFKRNASKLYGVIAVCKECVAAARCVF